MPGADPVPSFPSHQAESRIRRIIVKTKALLVNREVMTYLVFGVLTTALNYVVYFGLRRFISWPVANTIAWVVAVEFAFVTNRALVFRSKGNYFKEMVQFYLSRLATLGLEIVTILIVFDWLGAPEWFAKLFANVLVVIGNYVLSKLIVFSRRHKPGPADGSGGASGED